MTFRALVLPVLSVAAMAIGACSAADERPAPMGDAPVNEAIDAVRAAEDAGEGGHDAGFVIHEWCTPGAVQDCRLYFKDSYGQEQCPMSYQICKQDGSDWWPCGAKKIGAPLE